MCDAVGIVVVIVGTGYGDCMCIVVDSVGVDSFVDVVVPAAAGTVAAASVVTDVCVCVLWDGVGGCPRASVSSAL